MSKIFAIFKASEKKSEKSPDYNISMKVGDKYVNIGGAWLKDGKNGKFFSCKLSNAYGDRKGYKITEDGVQTKAPAQPTQAPAPSVPYPTENINPSDIPF